MSLTSPSEGGLIVFSEQIIEDTPTWCSLLQRFKVHHIILLWKPSKMSTSQPTAKHNMSVSPTFSLGEPWLKANLVLAKKDTASYHSLYLKVPPEHETRVICRTKVANIQNLFTKDFSTNFRWEHLSERPFGKADEQGDHGWILHPNGVSAKKWCTSSIRVDLELVISDNASGFGLDRAKILDDFHDLQMEQSPAGLGTDVILKNGTTELGAHKFILSARSSVFKVMLASDMAEARSGVIELKQMSVQASQDFISFIYSGRINQLRLLGTAEELLQVATMYDMPDLKAVCESSLRGMITAQKTAQFLVLASLHNAPMLKADTLTFLASNKRAVTATEEWAEAMTEHSKILLETILEII